MRNTTHKHRDDDVGDSVNSDTDDTEEDILLLKYPHGLRNIISQQVFIMRQWIQMFQGMLFE